MSSRFFVVLALALVAVNCGGQGGGTPARNGPDLAIQSLASPADGSVIDVSQIPPGSYYLQEIHYFYLAPRNLGGGMKQTLAQPGQPQKSDPVVVDMRGKSAMLVELLPMNIEVTTDTITFDSVRNYTATVAQNGKWDWEISSVGDWGPGLSVFFKEGKVQGDGSYGLAQGFAVIQSKSEKITLGLLENTKHHTLRARFVYLKGADMTPAHPGLILKK